MAVENSQEKRKFDFVVVGGGIAAVSCAEYLALLKEDATICVISSSNLIKTVSNVRNITRNLKEFDAVEKPLSTLSSKCPNVTVFKSTVVSFDPKAHQVQTSCNKDFLYKKLCICSGARPKLIIPNNQHVLGLRDVHSIEYLQNRLSLATKVVVIGNGGIALELVYELSGCEVIWVIKDDSIGNAYFDKGAAQFFIQSIQSNSEMGENSAAHKENKNIPLAYQLEPNTETTRAAAIGHGWTKYLSMEENKVMGSSNVHIEYNCEVAAILTPQEYKQLCSDSDTCPKTNKEWNVYIQLTNKKVFGCDFLVSATGVVPNTETFTKCAVFDIESDGGLKVDDHMRTNICDVYAAGDVCSAGWLHSDTWFQMRLWTQANQMGAYTAKCMLSDMNGEAITMDFCFELFAHATSFFGYKVILLGKYNGQGLGSDYQVLLRCTKGHEYVKVVVHNGRIQGALLIGDTDLEETLENLILNQMDISAFGEDILNPNIDIEDFFD